MADLNLKLSVVSDCTKLTKEEEECMKSRKQTLTRQQPFKKGHVGISESSTHSVLRSSVENDFHRCKQNKVIRVYCVCIIEGVSSLTVLTRSMIDF